MLPTRAGEFILGVFTAWYVLKYNSLTPKLNIILSFLGIALVFYSIFYFTEKDIYPGYNAIVPTIGTAILILSGHYNDTLVKKALSFRVFVYIGKISYSAYLSSVP